MDKHDNVISLDCQALCGIVNIYSVASLFFIQEIVFQYAIYLQNGGLVFRPEYDI